LKIVPFESLGMAS